MTSDGTPAPRLRKAGRVLGWTAFGLSQVVLLPLTIIIVLGVVTLPLALIAGTVNVAVSSPASLTFHVEWAPWAILGCLVLSGVAALLARASWWTSGVAAVPLGLAALIFAWAGLSYNSRRVDRYCSYGAVSQAQLNGCRDHVHVSDFADSDTPAARYGMYRSNACDAGSGPFCTGRRAGKGGFFDRGGGFFGPSDGGY